MSFLINQGQAANGQQEIHRPAQLGKGEIESADRAFVWPVEFEWHGLSAYGIGDLNKRIVFKQGRIRRNENSASRGLNVNQPVFFALFPRGGEGDLLGKSERREENQCDAN